MMDTEKKDVCSRSRRLARRLVAIVTPRQRCARWGTRFSHQLIPASANALIRRMRALPVDFHCGLTRALRVFHRELTHVGAQSRNHRFGKAAGRVPQ